MTRRLGAMSGMAVGTAVSRATGVVRDVMLIASIGTGVFADTYSVANSIPNIIYILVAGGAINAVFVPALVRHMADDADGGQAFIDRLFTVVTALLAAVVLAAMTVAGWLVHLYATSEWAPADFRVGTVFAYWCLPQVLFYGIYTVLAQVLNAREVFIAPMFAPVANNIVVIATAMAFLAGSAGTVTTGTVSDGQLALLGAGTTMGVVVQAALLVPALRSAGLRVRLSRPRRGSGLGKVGDLAVWTIGFVLVNQVSFLVISRLTTYANVLAENAHAVPSGFTTYQKAQLMMMLPHAVITVSIITALLPRISRKMHGHDTEAVAADVVDAARLIVSLLVPCAALLALLGPVLGAILYGHGASDPAQGIEVGRTAAVFALGLPAFSMFYLLLRTYYAQEDTRTPFLINLAFNALHLLIGVSAFWAAAPQHKVAALAAGYSVAYTVTAAVTWRRVAARLPGLKSAGLARHVARAVAAAALAGAMAALVHTVTVTQLGYIGLLAQATDLLLSTATFAACYLYLAIALRVLDPRSVMRFRGSQ